MGVGEKRVIIFDKDGIVQLERGARIVIEGDMIKIHSSDRKEVTYFDSEGKFIDKHPTVAESHEYTDFGCLKYFEKMGKKERKAVKHWLKSQKPKSKREEAFLSLVKDVTQEVQYGYHIATIEASFDGEKICYKENGKSNIELSKNEWAEKAEEFAPQYKSRVATLDEFYYWFAYKIATGKLSLDDFCSLPQSNKILVLREI